jgi:hypothetical protein
VDSAAREEANSDYASICKCIEETYQDAKVIRVGNTVDRLGCFDYTVEFIVYMHYPGIYPNSAWVEETFGKIFAKGLVSIDIQHSIQNFGPVSRVVGPSTALIKVNIPNLKYCLFEMNQKLAWKEASREFDGLMDNLLLEKK